jgi:hypothetical protein
MEAEAIKIAAILDSAQKLSFQGDMADLLKHWDGVCPCLACMGSVCFDFAVLNYELWHIAIASSTHCRGFAVPASVVEGASFFWRLLQPPHHH